MEASTTSACYPYEAWTPDYPTPEYLSGYEIQTDASVAGQLSLPVLSSLSEMNKQHVSPWYYYQSEQLMRGDFRRNSYSYHQHAYQQKYDGHALHPVTIARRNERERDRVKTINSTFGNLRQHLPTSGKNKKLSKVQILRAAIQYINQLQDILDVQEKEIQDPDDNQMLIAPDMVKPDPDAGEEAMSSGDSNSVYDSESLQSYSDTAKTGTSSIISSSSLGSEPHSQRSPFNDDDGQDILSEFSDWMK